LGLCVVESLMKAGISSGFEAPDEK